MIFRNDQQEGMLDYVVVVDHLLNSVSSIKVQQATPIVLTIKCLSCLTIF